MKDLFLKTPTGKLICIRLNTDGPSETKEITDDEYNALMSHNEPPQYVDQPLKLIDINLLKGLGRNPYKETYD